MGIINQTLFFAEATTRGGARPGEGVECPISVKSLSQERDPFVSNSRDTSSKDTKHCFFLKKTFQNINLTSKAIAAMGITPMQKQASPAGRLAHFIMNWQKLTKDRWVLNTVTGYKIDFITEPCQHKIPNPSQLSQLQQELVSQEISELISKGAISELQTTPVPGNGFLSTLFLVPKKMGVRDL